MFQEGVFKSSLYLREAKGEECRSWIGGNRLRFSPPYVSKKLVVQVCAPDIFSTFCPRICPRAKRQKLDVILNLFQDLATSIFLLVVVLCYGYYKYLKMARFWIVWKISFRFAQRIFQAFQNDSKKMFNLKKLRNRYAFRHPTLLLARDLHFYIIYISIKIGT